ncbi:MAG: formate dehydrogenase accessory sulfurtransferase FdhD, partial [Selenomonas sp.]|nr:formate dehydrogenase accessory sulfurtransferase FdhD [Selenomonas sp.]
LRNHVEISDKIIIFSGRCSSEMMLKLGRMGISTVAAKSVPTTLSLNIARKLGITLCARMAPGSFCIYANPERIIL